MITVYAMAVVLGEVAGVRETCGVWVWLNCIKIYTKLGSSCTVTRTTGWLQLTYIRGGPVESIYTGWSS